MAVGITTDTFFESAYITLQEYKDAPTSIDYDNLVVGGNANAQDAELTNVILRASSFMNEYLNQNLNATQYVETQRTRFMNSGYISLHPNNNPIISLSDFQYGATPNTLVALPDCSICWFENQQIIIPVSDTANQYSSQGPLSFGGGYPNGIVYTQYTYVSGYVNNPVAVAEALASTITVASGVGIVAGQRLRIYDGSRSENVTVASTYTYGSTTVPIEGVLLYTHPAGVTIGNIPNVIKEACILITTALLKARGDSSLTMQITTYPSSNIDGATRFGSDIKLALDMCDKYRRVR